jgi:nucleoside-diphosphate-sugar epimerase
VPDRLVITGGAGRIGTAMRDLLGAEYALRLVDSRPLPSPAREGEEFVRADVTELATMQRAFAGAAAVLHLAGDPRTSAPWTALREANIQGTYAVFEAARRADVGKVIFASTNHVMGFWNLEGAHPIGVDQPIRPDSLYGVSKAFGEALARYYSDAFEMSMICVRIGWYTDRPPHDRQLSPLWISARDLAQMFRLCLWTSRRFGIYNASSNNHQRHWDLSLTHDELGFEPLDDVADFMDPAAVEGLYVDPRAGVLNDSDGG